jgi:MFS family permease
MSSGEKVFYGWWVVVALFFVGMLGPMGRYTLTAFGPYIHEELGWSVTSIGLALTISLWVYAFASIPVGWLIDRVGSRRIVLIGGCLLLIGLWAFSSVSYLWQLYLTLGGIVGLGVSMTHFLTTQSTARKWFTRRAGLAGGILTAAFWIGSGTLSPLLTGLANITSWRTASVIYALSAGMSIILLAVFVIRDTPESMGLSPDGQRAPRINQSGNMAPKGVPQSTKQALKTSSFWMIFFGYSLIGIPGQGLLGHLVLWGVKLGSPKASAGLFLSAFTLSLAFTSVLGGWLGDKFGKRQVLMISYGLSALVSMACWKFVQTPQSLMLLVATFGLAYGIAAGPSLWAAHVGDVFGRGSVGKLFGVLTYGYGLIGGLGPLIWGRVHDITGTYNLACLLSGGCLVLVVIFLYFAKPLNRVAQEEKDLS